MISSPMATCDSGRALLNHRQRWCHENGGDVVRHDQAELALRDGWIEGRALVDNRLRLQKHLPDWHDQLLSERSENHLAAGLHEVVAEVLAQSAPERRWPPAG